MNSKPMEVLKRVIIWHGLILLCLQSRAQVTEYAPIGLINQPLYTFVEDINGDGLPDVISASSFRLITAYINLGSGEFSEGDLVDFNTNTMLLDDYDGNQTPDILSWNNNQLFLLRNDGNGAFAEPELLHDSIITITTLADMDLDGDLDVIASDRTEVRWYANLGDGVLSTEFTSLFTDEYILGMHFADMNQDGLADLIYSTVPPIEFENSSVSYRVRYEEGTFGEEIKIEEGNSFSTPLTSIGDIDGDGDLDIATIKEGATIGWLENEGGQFLERKSIEEVSFPVDEASPQWIGLHDYDSDGDADLIVHQFFFPEKKALLYENMAGSFRLVETYENFEFDRPSICADLDKDGNVDLIVTSPSDDFVGWTGIPKSATSIFERSMIPEFAVFPNPATDWLTVDLLKHPSNDLSTVRLYSSFGMSIGVKLSDSNSEINISNLANGIYWGQVMDGRGATLGLFRFVKI